MLPPNVKVNFNDNDPWTVASLFAYEQIREMEEAGPEIKEPRLPRRR